VPGSLAPALQGILHTASDKTSVLKVSTLYILTNRKCYNLCTELCHHHCWPLPAWHGEGIPFWLVYSLHICYTYILTPSQSSHYVSFVITPIVFLITGIMPLRKIPKWMETVLECFQSFTEVLCSNTI
jgi:hypothetical protein